MYLRTRRELVGTFILGALIAAIVPALAKADDAPPATSRPAAQSTAMYECRWADDPITIDGKANESEWKDAQTIDRFEMPWLAGDSRKPHTATKAKLLWDRE